MAIDEDYYVGDIPIKLSVPESFLRRCKLVFHQEEQYDKYCFNQTIRQLHRNYGGNSQQLRSVVTSRQFWTDVETRQRTSIVFNDGTGSFHWIARRFFQYFFSNMNCRSSIHRDVYNALKPVFGEKSQEKIESFIDTLIGQDIVLDEHTDTNPLTTTFIDDNSNDYLNLPAASSTPTFHSPIGQSPAESSAIKSPSPTSEISDYHDASTVIGKKKKKDMKRDMEKRKNDDYDQDSESQHSLSPVNRFTIQDDDNDGDDNDFPDISRDPRLNHSKDRQILSDEEDNNQSRNKDVGPGNDISVSATSPSIAERLPKKLLELRKESFKRKLKDLTPSETSENSLMFRFSPPKHLPKDVERVLKTQITTEKGTKKRRRLIGESDEEDSVISPDVIDFTQEKENENETGEEGRTYMGKRVKDNRIVLEKKKRTSFHHYDNEMLSEEDSIVSESVALFKKPNNHNAGSYSETEDRSILVYIAQKGGFKNVKGIQLWNQMAEHLKSGRTALSLKERFFERILPHVGDYCDALRLTPDVRDQFNLLSLQEAPGASRKPESSGREKDSTDFKMRDKDSSEVGKSKRRSAYFLSRGLNEESEPEIDAGKGRDKKEKKDKVSIDGINLVVHNEQNKNRLNELDDDFDSASKLSSKVSGLFNGKKKRPYNDEDDDKILHYVFRTAPPQFSSDPISGNRYWQIAAEVLFASDIMKRPWSSLKERFRKKIVFKLYRNATLNTKADRKNAIKCYQAFSKEWEGDLNKYDAIRKKAQNARMSQA